MPIPPSEDSTRRAFLRQGGLGGLAALIGCKADKPMGLDDTGTTLSSPTGAPGCPDPFAGGEFLEEMPFSDMPTNPFDEMLEQGWDGRRVFDLRTLADGDLEAAAGKFYVRTEYPDLLTTDERAWTIAITGLVGAPADVHIDDVYARKADQGQVLIECSGNGGSRAFGLMSAATWAGAPLMALIEDFVTIDPSATRVLVSGFDEHSVPSAGGHSTPGASWIFSFEELETSGAFLATELSGEPLPLDNGFPVRLVVPNWYGCTCIKWVNAIELVDDTAPATSQMTEFASRVHQQGTPALAADFSPADMELSATPVRVEKWRLNGEIAYRIVGIVWGGDRLTDKLRIRIGNKDEAVTCFEHQSNRTWNLYSHLWIPTKKGAFALSNYADDGTAQIRLDQGYYDREVTIDEKAG